jgi:hypothetical protein
MERTMPEVTKVRALLGILAVLVLVAFVGDAGWFPTGAKSGRRPRRRSRPESSRPRRR